MHRLTQTLVALALVGLCLNRASGQGVADAFFPTGISGGGRLMSASIHPEDSAQAFIVCDMMGVDRTTNEGLTWRLIPTDRFAATTRTQLQFAGTGAGQRIYGTKKLKWGSNKSRPAYSADGGESWTLMAEPPSPSLPDQYYSLEIDSSSTSASTQRLVTDNYKKLWFSNGGGGTGSWTQIHEHTGSGPDSMRLGGVFWDGSTIIVGTNVGAFRSTNGGSTWSPLTQAGLPAGARIVQFRGAKHPSTGAVTLFAVFVSYDVEGWHDSRSVDEANDYLGLYSGTLSGSTLTWTNRTAAGVKLVRVDVTKADSTRVWASTHRDLVSGAGIYKSTNGGVNWTQTFLTAGTGHSSNQNFSTGYQGDGGILTWDWSRPTFSLEVDESDPNRVLVTGEFPYLTDDGGASWMQMYVDPGTENPANATISKPKDYRHSGLGVTTGNWVHWVNEQTLLVGNCDVGISRSSDGGVSWTTDPTPQDGAGLAPSNWYAFAKKPGAGRLYSAVSTVNDFYELDRLKDIYVNGSFGAVFFSDNNGASWSPLAGGSRAFPDSTFPGPVVEVAVDPANPDHLYTSSADSRNSGIDAELGGVYRTTDGGSTWSMLSRPPRTEGRPLSIRVIGTNELVVTYCARDNGSGTFTASSGVFHSTNGGTSWSDVSHADMHYYTRDIAVDPSNSSRWFVGVQSAPTNADPADPTFDGRGGVYRTTTKGAGTSGWTKIWEATDSPSAEQVISVTYVNASTPILYVTTRNDGLWYSTDPNAANPTFAKVTAFPFARARRVFVDPYRTDGTIWVTTQGGGIWRGTVLPTLRSRILRSGSNYDLEVDLTGTGGAPTLWGITNLANSPTGWSLINSITPTTSSPAPGVTRYRWASVNAAALFSSSTGGFVRAVRLRGDGTSEKGEAQGWITQTMQRTHVETWGVPWMKESDHTTSAVRLGSTLLLQAPLTAALMTGRSYYFEILEGAHEGHRIEIIEASSSGSSITLDVASVLNTISPPPNLNGERIALRQHWVLSELFPVGDFVGTGSAATSDKVQLYVGTGFQSYFKLFAGSFNQWTRVGDATLANQGGKVVLPGEGVFLDLDGAGATRTVRGWGAVRSIDFRGPVALGNQLHSAGHPVAHSPVTNHLLVADGFVPTMGPATADQFLLWIGDTTPGGSGYTSYWYFNHPSGPYYARVGDATLANVNNALLFPFQRAFFTDVDTPKPNRLIQCPWTP